MANSPFVTVDWLVAQTGNPNVKVVDASWHLPTANRNAAKEFEAAHVPNAVFFDIDKIAQQNTDLPHMMASQYQFGQQIGALGISEQDTIVVYDSVGLFSAARAAWNFSIMGAHKSYVLEGGLPAWQNAEHPVETGADINKPASFNARLNEAAVLSANQVLTMLNNGSEVQIVDVRPADRFHGHAAEPRPGVRSGHMPGSLNLPFPKLLENGKLRTRNQLTKIFSDAGIDTSRPIIATCGSGVTAPILNLALSQMGINAIQVYDGSWAEWGANPELPIITTPK